MERDSNLGYVALAKQSAKLTPVIPSIYLPAYKADIRTNANLQKQNPIIGSKFGNRSTLRGQRGHNGKITFEGEPVTAGYLFDMLLTKGSSSGSNPTTHPFGLSKTQDPNYYTCDVSYVTHVIRYVGLTASKVEENWEDNELQFETTVSALKVWDGREIASVSGQVVTFKTNYDARPTDGLVVGDTLQIYDVSAKIYLPCTITAIGSATQITVSGTITAAANGDYITIKPATAPSFNTLPTFEFANTEYRFGADAATALNAAHTPLENDITLALSHEFEDNEGSKRSGSRDPASLPRQLGNYEFKYKKYFDTPEDMLAFSNLQKTACVVRHFSYGPTGTVYELRITMNNLTQDNPQPELPNDEILYSEIETNGNLDFTDGQGMGVTVLNNVTTI